MPLLPDEETAAYCETLLGLLQHQQNDERKLYFNLQSLLRTIVLRLLSGEKQFFTNDYARIIFLADKYSFTSQLTDSLQKNRISFARVRSGTLTIHRRTINNVTKVIVILLRFCNAGAMADALFTFDDAITIKESETLFDDGRVMLETGRFDIIETLVFTSDKSFPVHCKVLAENGTEWNILFTHNFLAQASLLRHGFSIFCTSLLIAKTKNAQLLATDNTLLIIEPDILFDVTDISECFSGKSASISHYFVKKLLVPQTTSKEMFVGNIINTCFDLLLTKPDTELEQALRIGLHYKPIMTLAALKVVDEQTLMQEIKQHYTVLQAIIPLINSHIFTVEASFLSPIYGLQGRVDVLLEYADDDKRKTVIELKSGKPPNAYNQRGNVAYGMWKNHEAQIMCYNLLVDSAYPERSGDSSVLYSREKNTPLRNMPNTFDSKRAVLALRNEIVVAEQDILQKKFAVFSRIQPEEFDDAPSFIRDKFLRARTFLDSLNDTEKVYHRATMTFLLREHYAARLGNDKEERDCGNAGLWKKTLEEKVLSFSAINGLMLDIEHSDFDSMHLAFFITDTQITTSFRTGDIVIAYEHDEARSPVQGQLLKARIKELHEYSLVLSFRNKLLPRSIFIHDEQKKWVIEPDFMDSANHVLFGLLTQLLLSPQEKRAIYLGMQPPVYSVPIMFNQEECRKNNHTLPDLTNEQYTILCRMIATQDYFLLQGPPGTGKTSVMLKWCAYLLYEKQSATILITAYTNRAVDEILRAVAQVIPHEYIIRLGNKDSTDYPNFTLDTISQGKSIQELGLIVNKARCVVTTVSSLMTTMDIFAIKTFDVMVVDEAAQIVEPYIAGFAATIGKVILIGDEKQLPAVINQNEELSTIRHPLTDAIECTDFRMSLFERLLRCCLRYNWAYSYAMLSQQGRMHSDIASFVNSHFYEGKLLSPFSWQHSLLCDEFNAVTHDISQSRMIFIPVYSTGKGKIHEEEASIAARIAMYYHRKKGDTFTENSLGIITPFRAQIMEIRKRISSECSKKIVVDTVERFQGSERDNIIISFALSNPTMLSSVTSVMHINNATIDRKLNVAITRARQQLIIIGNPDILCKEGLFAELLSTMEWINPTVLSEKEL
ncbi:MAG: AAA domain-containing protein [Candidatus Kapaibacterium sp.]|jgi:DNA replication ATP-dependent helicase Dna2